jgi:hypothetical protein
MVIKFQIDKMENNTDLRTGVNKSTYLPSNDFVKEEKTSIEITQRLLKIKNVDSYITSTSFRDVKWISKEKHEAFKKQMEKHLDEYNKSREDVVLLRMKALCRKEAD